MTVWARHVNQEIFVASSRSPTHLELQVCTPMRSSADDADCLVLAGVLDENGKLGEYETSRGFRLALIDEGEVTMKSLMDREKQSIMKVIYLQRALSLLWGYLVYAAITLALRAMGVDEFNGHRTVVDSYPWLRAREVLVFGLGGLIIGVKWCLVYGIGDFTGHETSAQTIILLGVSASLLAVGARSSFGGKPSQAFKKKPT